MNNLFRCERGAAATTALRVGVREFPSTFEQVLNGVVDLDAGDELRALSIHEDVQSIDLVGEVTVGRGLFQVLKHWP